MADSGGSYNSGIPFARVYFVKFLVVTVLFERRFYRVLKIY